MDPFWIVDEKIMDEAIKRLKFPTRFDWGAATSGYQSEGGYNGPGQPKNNWYEFETKGLRETTGRCTDFWNRYTQDLDLAEQIGCNSFRLGIEWARIQPVSDPSIKTVPNFDESALDHYADILNACVECGMRPVLTLFHFTHPYWLGLDAWLDERLIRKHFIDYVEHSVLGLNKRLIAKGKKPLDIFITINEPLMVPLASYIARIFPHVREGIQLAVKSFVNQLIAHVDAYRTIHSIYKNEKWPTPQVTTNGWCSMAYETEMVAYDLFLAKTNGIKKSGIHSYIEGRRQCFNKSLFSIDLYRDHQKIRRLVEYISTHLFRRLFKLEKMERLIDVIYEGSEDERLLDVITFDYYDPYFGDMFDLGGFPPLKFRTFPWQWRTAACAFYDFLKIYADAAGDLPIAIVENGLGYRSRTRRGWARPDGAKRDIVLQAHLQQLIRGLADGINITGYFYWTLYDNYEWGSFEPRFGLLGIDYKNNLERMPHDIIGNNAVGAYKDIISAFQSHDKNALINALYSKEHSKISVESK